MNCETVRDQADLYLYGELASEEEEGVEQHLHTCPACRTELDRRRAVHRGLDGMRLEPPPALLAECRRELFQARPIEPRAPWRPSWFTMWRQPAAALAAALIALGFFSSRFTARDATPWR